MNLEELQKGQVLLIDKPLHWTSFDVVNKLRYAILKKFNLKKFKVGHAGTLDPLATGLLIICVGKATKKIHLYQNSDKEYTGTFFIGATTPSYDLETEVNQTFKTEHITDEMIYETAKSFVGIQQQTPPIFSAIKKKGKRLYEHARKGEEVEIKSRQVEIKSFEILSINLPEIRFKVTVSKGTYIRSLAYDFGKALMSGAYLAELRRTKIGDFTVEQAIDYQNWIDRYIQHEK
jgi:tRNA pseudouridine55 synthase